MKKLVYLMVIVAGTMVHESYAVCKLCKKICAMTYNMKNITKKIQQYCKDDAYHLKNGFKEADLYMKFGLITALSGYGVINALFSCEAGINDGAQGGIYTSHSLGRYGIVMTLGSSAVSPIIFAVNTPLQVGAYMLGYQHGKKSKNIFE